MRALRLVFGLSLVFLIAVVASDLRSRGFRRGYRFRRLLDEAAALRNEVSHLRGVVLELETPAALLRRASERNVDVGRLGAPEVVAPPPARHRRTQ